MALRTLVVTLLAGLGWITAASDARACSCIYRGPACQAYWTTDAVFDATVASIEKIERHEFIGDRPVNVSELRVTLQVHAAWKGVSTGEVQVATSPGGGSCGFDFEQGVRYLVFAYHHNGLFRVSTCSLTRRYEAAGASLAFLGALEKPAEGGRVFGKVTTYARSFDPERPSIQQATVTDVTLVAGGERRTIRSAGGEYEFTRLAPGSYRVEIGVPDGHTTYSAARDVQILNPRACAEENFGFSPNGRIAGRVVDTNGRGLEGVRVEIASADAQPHPSYGLSTSTSLSDSTGYFEVGGLPPGRYIAGVNLAGVPTQYNPHLRNVFPGATSDPQVISLQLGQAVDLGTWFMPPPPPAVRVTGIVTREDGSPVADVYVHAWDRPRSTAERGRGVTGSTSGPDGRFVLELRQGRVYTFTARGPRAPLRIRSPRLDTGTQPLPLLQIVILDDRR